MRTAHHLAGQTAAPTCADTANDGHARNRHDHPLHVAVAAWVCLPPCMARSGLPLPDFPGRLATCSPGSLCNGTAWISLRNDVVKEGAPSFTAVLQGQQLQKRRGAAVAVGTTHGSGAPASPRERLQVLGDTCSIFMSEYTCIAALPAPSLCPLLHLAVTLVCGNELF
jgi:hypothetical protein